MADYTLSGATISHDPALPATFDVAGFDALVGFVEVGQTVSIDGAPGKSYNGNTFTLLKEQIEKTCKGSYSPGTITLVVMRDDADAGQIQMNAAVNSNADQSFKITYPDGSIDYAAGMVMSDSRNLGGTDALRQRTYEITLNYDIVEKAAP